MNESNSCVLLSPLELMPGVAAAEGGLPANPQARPSPAVLLPACRWLREGFFQLSMWATLPLAIWLSAGWIGLMANWQTLAGWERLWTRTPADVAQPSEAGMADSAETGIGTGEGWLRGSGR